MTSQSFSEKQSDDVDKDHVSQKADSVNLLSRQDTATRRIRIIHLLRKTFGDDLEKLPQFAAIVNCLKNECAHTFTEIATQTNNDIMNANGDLYRTSSNSLRHRAQEFKSDDNRALTCKSHPFELQAESF